MENHFNELLPYLILDESADVALFMEMMEKEGIEIVLKWRYYYGYKDAIRIIDFVETKGIYDAWVVFLPENCQEKADRLLKKHPSILSYFEPAEERFFRGLEISDLKKTLASQQMTGRSLALALKVLKEQNIIYTDNEIQTLKEALLLENAKKSTGVGRAKILIYCLFILIITIYLWFMGLFS